MCFHYVLWHKILGAMINAMLQFNLCNKILGLKYMEFIQIPDNVLTLGTQVKFCLHVTPNIAYNLIWEANHIEFQKSIGYVCLLLGDSNLELKLSR